MRLVLIEDDPTIAVPLTDGLRRAGFEVVVTATARDGLAAVDGADLVLLDLGLPDLDGSEVCRRIRETSSVPIIVISARGEEIDRVLLLESGADDYLVKPFEMGEAVLRVQALVRRSRGHASPEIACGALRLDTHRGEVTVNGEPVALTAQEYRLVSYLAHESPRIVSRSELLDHVYERGLDPDSNVIDALIVRVRRKIGAERIETLRGRGFRMQAIDE